MDNNAWAKDGSYLHFMEGKDNILFSIISHKDNTHIAKVWFRTDKVLKAIGKSPSFDKLEHAKTWCENYIYE